MTPEKSGMTETPHSLGKPFPWRCPECGKKAVQPATVPHVSQIKHDGRLYAVAVPALRVPQCSACGELVFDNGLTSRLSERCAQLGLLSGDQIRKNREDLGLSQRLLAEYLGVAVETISRWEIGALTQTRAMDRYLRVYFGVPAALPALLEPSGSLSLGVQVQV